MRRAILLPALLAGCAYYNGVYNARRAAARGDRAASEGRPAAAESAYAASAASAEGVLSRHPKSKWADEARFLAGRGAAMMGDCPRAIGHLREYLSVSPSEPERSQAVLALGRCLYRSGDHAGARTTLAPLLDSDRREIADEAARYVARAAFAMGDARAAEAVLSKAPMETAHWELLRFHVERHRLADAESLLVLRAAAGDMRSPGVSLIDALWRAGRHDGVFAIVDRYLDSPAPSRDRAQLALRIARHCLTARLHDQARRHLELANGVGADSAIRRAVAAHRAVLDARAASTVDELKDATRRGRYDGAGGPEWAGLQRSAAMIDHLARRFDPTGAPKFLAAELARDSVGAFALAHALFLEAAASNGVIAPKALMAAAVLVPDSATAYHRRVLQSFPDSPYAAIIRGVKAPESSTAGAEDVLLQGAWTAALQALPDSLRNPASAHGGAAPAAYDSVPPAQ